MQQSEYNVNKCPLSSVKSMPQRPKILLVEDSRFFSQLVSKALKERLDANVVCATTFAETREALENESPFDMALVDIVLPDSKEGEAIEYILGKKIPSIVFTGFFSDDLRERLLSMQVIDYVIKNTPASLNYLLDLVERLHKNTSVKVMVVDDSKTAREYLKDLLTRYRFDVVTAASGKEALEILDATPGIRAAIIDYHMPEMNGVQLVKSIRNKFDPDTLTIIGLSSAGSHVLSAEFIKHGANDFLTKPFLREEFFHRLMQNVRMLDLVDRLKESASRDFLTGLHNRRFFLDAGANLFAGMKRGQLSLTVAMIDIDHFKQINDTHGHDAGDMVLRHIADILKNHCRQTDCIARFGGEEFAILALNLSKEHEGAFFNKLRLDIKERPLTYGAKKIAVEISVGVCSKPLDTLENMLIEADRALYAAKEAGRDRVEIVNS
jgi:diguanylate cyclase (GGDEF)-like protein